jgi:hypothetical protein
LTYVQSSSCLKLFAEPSALNLRKFVCAHFTCCAIFLSTFHLLRFSSPCHSRDLTPFGPLRAHRLGTKNRPACAVGFLSPFGATSVKFGLHSRRVPLSNLPIIVTGL